MTAGRLAVIVVIFVGVSLAWMILGASVHTRTQTSKETLRDEVAALWGDELRQSAPTLTITGLLTDEESKAKKEPPKPLALSPDSTEVQVDLNLDLRRKGLLWYRTYKVTFDAAYRTTNPLDRDGDLSTTLFLPTRETNYDEFHFSVDGQEATPTGDEPPEADTVVKLAPGQEASVKVHYEARGMDSWRYSFGSGSLGVRNFKMVVRTDFDRIDFPPRTLSADHKRQLDPGWELTWESKHLISGLPMGVEMPEKLNPGPWAARLSFFAPVGLLFYVFVLVIVGVMRDENLHSMHYFLVAGGFFAFHLLLSYTVDHIDVHLAFVICSVVSVLLVVPYLMRAIGPGFALKIAAPAQLAFLVLFSYAFYFPGYTGLTITIASIATLGLIMHLTAKVDWEEKFKSVAPPRAGPPRPPPAGAPDGSAVHEAAQMVRERRGEADPG